MAVTPPLSQNSYLRLKLTTIITVVISLVTGGAAAVSTLYRVRDDALLTVSQKQQKALTRYTTHEELLQAFERMNATEDSRYSDIKDRIGVVGNKVDGVIIYLRRKL